MKSVNLTGKTDNLMNRLVSFILNTSYENLSEDLVFLSKQAIVDTMGVSLAGWNEDAVQKAIKVYASSETGEASLWGQRTYVDVEKAAIINGTASHVLDFDDASAGVIIHPSAPILAAITPLAEQLNSSGKEVITAYAIGTEVMVRIGEVMGINHYNAGWHATDTLGTIGAVAACASLKKLNEEQCVNAIAIGASMAGGLQKNFGSMTKPLHVGLAATHGIESVKLAEQDFTGNREIFGNRGFFLAFGGIDVTEEQLAEIQFGKPFDLLTGLSVKKFPCCFATHRFIHGALLLKEEHGIQIEDITKIVLHAQPRSLLPLVHSRPQTGLQGKFSAEYTVLAAILDGYVNLSSFEDQQVQREIIQQLMPKVTVLPLEDTEESKRSKKRLPVQLQIEANEVYKASIQYSPGEVELPLSENEHREKWLSCIQYFTQSNEPALTNRANQLYDQGLNLENANFKQWMNDIHQLLPITQSV